MVKTTKQTASSDIGYLAAASQIMAEDGINGLLFRGLSTKILSNGLQVSHGVRELCRRVVRLSSLQVVKWLTRCEWLNKVSSSSEVVNGTLREWLPPL